MLFGRAGGSVGLLVCQKESCIAEACFQLNWSL